VRASVDVTRNASIVGEWNRDKYKESATLAGSLANYDANRYGIYVRWKQ
jgi:hypothetical protein